MKSENCLGCRHNFVFHKMIDYHADDRRLYCIMCNGRCNEKWDSLSNA